MVMAKKLSLIILGCLLLAVLAGCTSREETVKEAVNDYNRTLIAVLDSGSVDLLNSVATEKEVRRMELFLTFLNEEKKRLSADLQEIRFLSVNITENVKPDGPNGDAPGQLDRKFPPEAEVRTEELWNYRYLDPETGAQIEGPFKIKYDAVYRLTKPDDRWIVYEVYFTEELMK